MGLLGASQTTGAVATGTPFVDRSADRRFVDRSAVGQFLLTPTIHPAPKGFQSMMASTFRNTFHQGK
jgi:hypothetical protein